MKWFKFVNSCGPYASKERSASRAMSRPVLSVAAIAAGFLLVSCETSGTRIKEAGVSATFQAQRFAFDNAAGIANEISLRGFPTSGTTLYASTISPRNIDSINPRNTMAVVLPPNCIGARPGECKVRSGDNVFACSKDGSALYCDRQEAGKSTFRLTYAVDGRFAMAQGGSFLSGVWYQGQSQKNQRAQLFAEMARLYDAAFARNLDTNLAEASRLHREDKRRRQDAIAVVTGVAAGLSGQNTPRQSGTSSSHCPTWKEQYAMHRAGNYCSNIKKIKPECRSSITCTPPDGSTGAIQ